MSLVSLSFFYFLQKIPIKYQVGFPSVSLQAEQGAHIVYGKLVCHYTLQTLELRIFPHEQNSLVEEQVSTSILNC